MIEPRRPGKKMDRFGVPRELIFVILTLIVSGRAIEHFEGYLNDHPKDLESMYGLAVAYAQKQEIEKAVTYVQNAVDEEPPFARLVLPAGQLYFR